MDIVNRYVQDWYELCDERFTNHPNNEGNTVHLFKNLHAAGVTEDEIEKVLREAFRKLLNKERFEIEQTNVNRVITLIEGMFMYCQHKDFYNT